MKDSIYSPVDTSHYMFKNLVSHRFGRLIVLELLGKVEGNTYWRCACDCGAECRVRTGHLNSGATRSCGCLSSEVTRKRCLKHGQSVGRVTKEYQAWAGMKDRCYNVNDHAYDSYGGRGITVCERWLESFSNFFADMGKAPSPKHSVDRIDNDKGYGPDNCRWATPKQQNNNTRQCTVVVYQGHEYPSLSALASSLGINSTALRKRVNRLQMPLEEAVSRARQR